MAVVVAVVAVAVVGKTVLDLAIDRRDDASDQLERRSDGQRRSSGPAEPTVLDWRRARQSEPRTVVHASAVLERAQSAGRRVEGAEQLVGLGDGVPTSSSMGDREDASHRVPRLPSRHCTLSLSLSLSVSVCLCLWAAVRVGQWSREGEGEGESHREEVLSTRRREHRFRTLLLTMPASNPASSTLSRTLSLSLSWMR